MSEHSPSAFAAMRALRKELKARLDQSEDYRAWKALDEALRELEPPMLPKAVDLALDTFGLSSRPNVPGVDVVVDQRRDMAVRSR